MAERRKLESDILSLRRQLAEAVKQRDQWNVQIVQLQGQLRALSTLHARHRLASAVQQQPKALVGITEAIRSVMRLTNAPMTAAEVKNHLLLLGFDFSSFSNPSAAVHTTLHRMASTGELRYIPVKKAYQKPNPFYGEFGGPPVSEAT